MNVGSEVPSSSKEGNLRNCDFVHLRQPFNRHIRPLRGCVLRYHGLLMSKVGTKAWAGRPPGPSLVGLLKPYRALIATLVAMTIAGNSLNLVVPRLIAHAIDTYAQQRLVLTTLIVEFFAVGSGIFLLLFSGCRSDVLVGPCVPRF